MSFSIRTMHSMDIDAVLAIESEHYSGSYIESADVIRVRLGDYPDTAWVAEDADGVCAYLSGFWSKQGMVMPLGHAFPRIDNPDCLYLHDMAVAQRAAGRGIGKALARQALHHARQQGILFSSLISLAPALGFWQSLGYVEWPLEDPEQRARLDGYLPGARHLLLTQG